MNTKNTKKDSAWPLVILFLVIVLLWAISGFVIWYLSPDWQTSGTVGDTFGLINSLFSGLALAGVIYTILLQRNELKLQRLELELTREELSRTADAQENSEKALFEQSEVLRKTLIYQSFEALTNEYRTPKMLHSVRRLWDFYRRFGDQNLVEEYVRLLNEENEKVNAANDSDKVALQEGTLHSQRRYVSQFYSQIATFIEEGIIPESIFYSSWGETDLQIIPKILIPIENAIRKETIGNVLPDLDESSPLMQLYMKSKKRENVT